LKTKRINNAVNEIVENAKKSLLITGYSISEFVEDIIDTIIEKSQRGLFVKVFINYLSKQKSIDKLLRYQGKFLQLYNYANNDDKMAALHAKIILADGKRAIISSANLSYHGMAGNIEIGTLIHSEKLGKQIEEFFKGLIFQKVFKFVQ
jgi:phosphatidylserine/phosphatidylglycerophosphate/cardiolipin synthase-like enzyme